MKKALITGITGQDGAYLSKLLLEKGYKVYGLFRRRVNHNLQNLEYLEVADKIEFVDGDMIDEASLIKAIKDIQPDEVYNLAAQSFVGSSWTQASATIEINAMGTLKLLNAIKSNCPTAKFYQASSSEMFGNNSDNGVQTIDTAFRPRSPYGISKVTAHMLTVNYRESYGLFACCGILFNHESPIRGIEFVTRKITDGVAKIKLGLSDHIELGNLDAERDWGFAGDYVKAMWSMLQRDNPKDYIICTGKSHSLRNFINEAFKAVGITDWTKYIKTNPKYMRPAELNKLEGDNSLALQELEWKPKLDFKDLVGLMVKEDIRRIEIKIVSYENNSSL